MYYRTISNNKKKDAPEFFFLFLLFLNWQSIPLSSNLRLYSSVVLGLNLNKEQKQ